MAEAPDTQKTHREEQRHWFALFTDVIMLVLIAINLLLILFQWFYANPAVQNFLATHTPTFQAFYHANIHEHFFWIDLGFIAIYLIEIFVQWVISAWNRTYRRWWYYPFVHWYDVLGCIPITTFRFFRVLRLFALIVKMQRLNIIDLKNTFLARWMIGFWGIVAEEITDRVVLNMLTAVQEEVQLGSPVTEEIGRRVIQPRRDALVEGLSYRLQHATQEAYAHYRPDVRRYVDHLISDAVNENRQLRAIQAVPVVGRQVGGLVEQSISDIVYKVVNDLIEDVASAENKAVVNHVAQISADTLLASGGKHDIDAAARDALIEALEVIKEHVRKKKERDDQALEEETRRLAGSIAGEVDRPGSGK